MNLSLAILVCSLALPVHAQQQRAPDPIDKFKGDSYFWQMMCTNAFSLAQLRTETATPQDAQSDWKKCISDGESAAKANYQAAMKIVRKKAAIEALKSAHVATLSALRGIAQDSEERRIVYVQRQGSLRAKADEAWLRFDVEK